MFATIVLASTIAGHAAHANTCGPTVVLDRVLDGNATTAHTLRQLLEARGVALAPCPTSDTPPIHVRLDRRGSEIVVAIERRPGEPPIERAIAGDDGLETAATVIESWAHPEVDAPLLASHDIPRARARVAAIEPLAPAPATTIIVDHTDRSHRRVDLFAAVESSYASDRTSWMGGHVGACVMLDPICVAARLRFSSVVASPEVWRGLERHDIDVLLGIDLPLHRGRFAVVPGFAAGVGSMHTRLGNGRGESGGMRADAHVTASVALAHHLAFDLALTGDLTQATEVGSRPGVDDLPDEPRALIRLSAGLRYGGL